jgi:hypothetical protein
VLAAQFRDRHTAFGLAQDRKDLGFAISRHLHQNLLRYLAEKILLPHPLSFGGDYRSTEALRDLFSVYIVADLGAVREIYDFQVHSVEYRVHL